MKNEEDHVERTEVDANEIAALATALTVLMNIQHDVSSAIPGCITPGEGPTSNQVRTYFLAFIVEAVELMNEFPAWKPWKEEKPYEPTRVIDEFADILAFMGIILNFMHELGINMFDVANGYAKKTNVNIARFNGEVDGYRIIKGLFGKWEGPKDATK